MPHEIMPVGNAHGCCAGMTPAPDEGRSYQVVEKSPSWTFSTYRFAAGGNLEELSWCSGGGTTSRRQILRLRGWDGRASSEKMKGVTFHFAGLLTHSRDRNRSDRENAPLANKEGEGTVAYVTVAGGELCVTMPAAAQWLPTPASYEKKLSAPPLR